MAFNEITLIFFLLIMIRGEVKIRNGLPSKVLEILKILFCGSCLKMGTKYGNVYSKDFDGFLFVPNVSVTKFSLLFA